MRRSAMPWIREDHADIPDVDWPRNLNSRLPSTPEGQAAIIQREQDAP